MLLGFDDKDLDRIFFKKKRGCEDQFKIVVVGELAQKKNLLLDFTIKKDHKIDCASSDVHSSSNYERSADIKKNRRMVLQRVYKVRDMFYSILLIKIWTELS